MLENKYQSKLIGKIKKQFPGVVILKNDSSYLQGVPDLSIFFEDRWAMLEVKKTERAPVGPNQDYYVDLFNSMSFASFVYPENEKVVLDGLQRSFCERRSARFS